MKEALQIIKETYEEGKITFHQHEALYYFILKYS